jgi:hypothetical protein
LTIPMRYRNSKRIVIVHISDPHAAHRLGLLNPETKIYSQTPTGLRKIEINFNEVNSHLWQLWTTKCIPEAIEYADGDDIALFITGDITAGNRHTEEVISPLVSHQIEMAKDVFMPWFEYKNVKAVRFATGTGVHVFGVGSSEMLVSDYLKPYFPKVDFGVVMHGLAEIRNTGVKIDYAHKGPYGGSRNWLRGNVARYYLQSLMQDEIDAGNVPPQIVLRGHFHTPVEEMVTKRCDGHKYRSQLVIAPSMCILDDYAMDKTQSSFRITNGIYCFELFNGRVGIPYEISETLDLRTTEVLL